MANLGLIAAFALAGAPSPGGPGADSGPSLAILPLTLEGSHEAGANEQFTVALVEGLSRGSTRVLAPDGLGDATPETACDDPGCLAKVAADARVTHVVRAAIAEDERTYAIQIQLSDADGRAVSTLTEECDICGIDEVVELVADLGGGIQSKLGVLTRAEPILSVTSTPAGARVLVDDTLVGLTPYSGEMNEGTHQIRVEIDGYIPRDRTITGVGGEVEQLSFELENMPLKKSRRTIFVAAGATSLGLGVAMMGGGIPLILLNGKQNKSDCEGDNVDINGRCRYSYQTLAGGITLVAGGAALAAVGAGLLARARIDRKKLRAQAFLGPTGVSLAGRF